MLLPVTTFLEHTDLYLAYGHYYLQLARPAVARTSEAKSNVEIFRMLAQRMGFCDPCFSDTEDDMIRALLETGSEHLQGITLDRLERERFVRLTVSPASEPFLPFAKGGFRTMSGRFEFGAETLNYTAPVESRLGDVELRERYPLELLSAKNDDSMNSTFGHRSEVDAQTAVLEIHPEDAECRQIVDGVEVRIYNDRGFCFFTARVSSDVSRGVVRARSTRWNKKSRASLGVNQLTSERLTDIGRGPTFYSCLVEAVCARSSQ